MIFASAQGVRLSTSKLRFSLQPLSIAEVSLVRGRSFWRVVNAREISNIYWRIKDIPQSVAMSSRVLKLVRRLVTGEEKNEALFDRLFQGLMYLAGGTGAAGSVGNLPTTREVMNLEFILLLQVLYTLGYFAPPTDLLWCINDVLSAEMIENMSVFRSEAILHINESIKETQL
jgi:recombinational DNA repair protein (RecF pathway)